jgi:hypothetical protein
LTEEIKLNWNIDKMPFTKELFKLVNKYKPGLEFQIQYLILIPLSARMVGGRGVLIIESMGTGKGASIKGTTHLLDKLETIFVGRITESGFLDIIKYLESKNPKRFKADDMDFELRIEDLSMTASKDYILEPTMNTASILISDRALGLCTDDIFRTFKDNISDLSGLTVKIKSMAVIMGGTNEIMYKIRRKLPSYRTMVHDRFTEYYPIKTKEQNEYIDRAIVNKLKREGVETVDRLDDLELRNMIYKIMPKRKLPDTILPFADNITEDLFNTICRDTYRRQHTRIRASYYLKGDLSALAWLNGSSTIELCHLAFFMLYYPNISVLHKCSTGIQSITQLCNSTASLSELAYELELAPKDIRDILFDYNRRYGKKKNPTMIYNKNVVLNPSFNKWLIRQEQFIKECMGED